MRAAGAQRKYRLIQEALDQRKMFFRDIARELGVSDTAVLKTARGLGNSRRVLLRFLELGIDPAILDLPDDLQAEHNAKGAA